MGQKVLIEMANELFAQSLADCSIGRALARKLSSNVVKAGQHGIDGNSTAAGAVIDESTLGQAEMRQNALYALQQYSSCSFLASTGSIIGTGPTGTNLRDLWVFLAQQPS